MTFDNLSNSHRESTSKMFAQKSSQVNTRKKPPPRPPPPNFSKYKSKSTFNLNQQGNLIEWSPPSSPKQERNSKQFGGSVSSSFSSSTSSLASSKRSFEFDVPVAWPSVPVQNQSSNFTSYLGTNNNKSTVNVPSLIRPTIIRARETKRMVQCRPDVLTNPPVLSESPPMPTIPPPSPPKDVTDVDIPYGIALYDFPASQPGDLSLQAGDVVILTKQVSNEWFLGKKIDKEGIFPTSFINIIVPLPEEGNEVTALYEFHPQVSGDLELKPGYKVKVTKIINSEWLYGTCHGKSGQFPSNFVDRIPNMLG